MMRDAKITQIYEGTNENPETDRKRSNLPIEKNIKLKIYFSLSKSYRIGLNYLITFFYFFIENFNEIYYETKKERKLNYLTHKKKQATLILVCEIFKGEIIWN